MKLARLLVAVFLLAAPACTAKDDRAVDPGPSRSSSGALTIAVIAPGPKEESESVVRGARMAAAESPVQRILQTDLRIDHLAQASAATLAGLTDDPTVIGVLSVGASGAVTDAADVVRSSRLAVLETRDDLYERGLLGPSIFQMNAPRAWQAFRLARYFGPGDRAYKKIGLAREKTPEGDAAARVLQDALSLRGLQFVDAAGDAESTVSTLRAQRPEAVVIEGSKRFIASVLTLLSSDQGSSYMGKSQIRDGWRPQPAGFESLLDLPAQVGSVAAGDYARPAQSDGRIERIDKFRSDFRKRFDRDPVNDEIYGYEAARALVEAASRAKIVKDFGRATRSKLIEELERFDRVRFSHLPISLGPDDHVFAERDVLGLYAFDDGRWVHLMRAFTSDLERTNLLEEDWAYYFEGAVPGGEAPFFHQSKGGIVTDRSDDLR